jgi:hypothetical protein
MQRRQQESCLLHQLDDFRLGPGDNTIMQCNTNRAAPLHPWCSALNAPLPYCAVRFCRQGTAGLCLTQKVDPAKCSSAADDAAGMVVCAETMSAAAVPAVAIMWLHKCNCSSHTCWSCCLALSSRAGLFAIASTVARLQWHNRVSYLTQWSPRMPGGMATTLLSLHSTQDSNRLELGCVKFPPPQDAPLHSTCSA